MEPQGTKLFERVGMRRITSTSGGYVDASGDCLSKLFPSDSYRLAEPASALMHQTLDFGRSFSIAGSVRGRRAKQ